MPTMWMARHLPAPPKRFKEIFRSYFKSICHNYQHDNVLDVRKLHSSTQAATEREIWKFLCQHPLAFLVSSLLSFCAVVAHHRRVCAHIIPDDDADDGKKILAWHTWEMFDTKWHGTRDDIFPPHFISFKSSSSWTWKAINMGRSWRHFHLFENTGCWVRRRYLLHFDVGNSVLINDLFVCLESRALTLDSLHWTLFAFRGKSHLKLERSEREERLMCQDVDEVVGVSALTSKKVSNKFKRA